MACGAFRWSAAGAVGPDDEGQTKGGRVSIHKRVSDAGKVSWYVRWYESGIPRPGKTSTDG